MILTLKEVFLKENKGIQSPIEQLEEYTRHHATSEEKIRHLYKQYEMFEDTLEYVATEIPTKQSPEERKYRANKNVDTFFKFLLTKTKAASYNGLADYDEMPGVEEYKDMLINFYKKNKKQEQEEKLVHKAMGDYEQKMPPEKKAEREKMRQIQFGRDMAAGKYGKLD